MLPILELPVHTKLMFKPANMTRWISPWVPCQCWPNRVTTSRWGARHWQIAWRAQCESREVQCTRVQCSASAVTFPHLFYCSSPLMAKPRRECGPWWRRSQAGVPLVPRRGGAPPSRLPRVSMPAPRCPKTPLMHKSPLQTLQIFPPSRRKKKSEMSGECLPRQKVELMLIEFLTES